MSLHTQLQGELKETMRAKDEIRLTLLRSLLTAFTNELVAKKRKPSEELEDEEVLTVLRRAAKQRQDSIEQFTKGSRPDLAEREEKELVIIQSYLPQMMSREEIEEIAKAKKGSMGITDPKEKGKFMGALMSDLKGKADGADVKAVIDSLFS